MQLQFSKHTQKLNKRTSATAESPPKTSCCALRHAQLIYSVIAPHYAANIQQFLFINLDIQGRKEQKHLIFKQLSVICGTLCD